MSAIGGPALNPPQASEIDDERHPLRGEEVIVDLLLRCRLDDDGALTGVHITDERGGPIAHLADLDHAAAQAVRVLLLGEVKRLTSEFHALPSREQDRRIAGKDAA